MDLKLLAKQHRDRADYLMLLGIKWARDTRNFPRFTGLFLADVWIAQLEAEEAEEEEALQAAINKAGAFA